MRFKFSIPLFSDDRNFDYLRAQIQASPQLGQSTHDNEIFWVVVIGKIYDFSSAEVLDLVPQWVVQPELLLKRNGRFIIFALSKMDQCLYILTDKYRILGGFGGFSQGHFVATNYFSTQEEWHSNFLCNRKANLKAIADLLILGFVQLPQTFIDGFDMFAGANKCNVSMHKMDEIRDWSWSWPQETAGLPNRSPKEFVSKFRQSLSDILKYFSIETFRLSGGSDTRLILSQLTKAEISSLQMQVICSAHLPADQDWDVMGALAVAELAGASCKVLKAEEAGIGYFVDLPNSRAALSGFFGGEFLGAVYMTEAPGLDLSVLSPALSFSELNIAEDIVSDVLQRKADRVSRIGLRNMIGSIYLNCFRSTIYRSIRFSWTQPFELGQFGLGPFSESRVLDFLFNTNLEELADYSFYRKIYFEELGKEWREIPISSPIVFGDPDQFKTFSSGVDPKTVSKTDGPQPAEIQALDYLISLGLCSASIRSTKNFPDHLKIRLKNIGLALDDYCIFRS